MKDKKEYILYLSIIILSLINLFVLFKYQSLGEDYIDEQNASKLHEYRSNSYSISNKFMSSPGILSNVISNSKAKKIINNEPIKFIVFSTNNDCTNCITDTILSLQKVVHDLDNKLLFIYEEININSYKFSKFFNANNYNFDNISIEFVHEFSEYSIEQFPIFIMYNHYTNSVVEAYQPEPNNFEALDAFIKRVKYHTVGS